jgi:hypothetical protein
MKPNKYNPDIRKNEEGEEYQYYFDDNSIVHEYTPGRANGLPDKLRINPQTEDVEEEIWRDSQYRLHREDGPAKIKRGKTKDWADWWYFEGEDGKNKWAPIMVVYSGPAGTPNFMFPNGFKETEWNNEDLLQRIYQERGIEEFRNYIALIYCLGNKLGKILMPHIEIMKASTGISYKEIFPLLKQ